MKYPKIVKEVQNILKKNDIDTDFSVWPEPFDDKHKEWYSESENPDICIMISKGDEPVICFMDNNNFDCLLPEFEKKLKEYLEFMD